MSMNLYARTKNETINLWQTPTQISYTILPRSCSQEVKGVKAKEAITCYLEWVHFSTNDMWTSREALKEAEENVKKHTRYIEQYLNDKTLTVGVM